MTFKHDEAGNTYVSLEEQYGKVWNVITFFGGKLDEEKLDKIEQFSLCFGIDHVVIVDKFNI